MFGFLTRVASAPVNTAPLPVGHPGGVTGHAGTGPAGSVLTPNSYGSGYTGPVLLTQRPGRIDGMQLWQGVEGLSSAWYTPPQLLDPTGYGRTQRLSASAGTQRVGGSVTGAPIGPITSRVMRREIVAQQIRQSGLAATQWAQGLSPQA